MDMDIHSSNISQFIKYLFWKRKGAMPSQELIDSWTSLSNEEIQVHLKNLFSTWGLSDEEMKQEVQKFILSQSSAGSTTEIDPNQDSSGSNERMNLHTGKVVYEPPVGSQPFTQSTNEPSEPEITKEEIKYQAPENDVFLEDHEDLGKSGRGIISKIVLFLLALGLGAGGFYGYKYYQFQNLKRIYVLTDNVAVRNANGELVGRMDMVPNAKVSSFSSLRVLDDKDYPIMVDGSEYDYRKVILDSIGFSDFLWNKEEVAAYVNSNYVTDDESDFQIYKNVFKDIFNNAKENKVLNSAYRKVIVRSILMRDDLHNAYLLNPCATNDKSLTGVLKYQVAGSKALVVLAKLSDGKYYIFSGNNETGMYEVPKEVQLKNPYSDDMEALPKQDYLFKKNGDQFLLYSCKGERTPYFTVNDVSGKLWYIAWEPPQFVDPYNLYNDSNSSDILDSDNFTH